VRGRRLFSLRPDVVVGFWNWSSRRYLGEWRVRGLEVFGLFRFFFQDAADAGGTPRNARAEHAENARTPRDVKEWGGSLQ